MQSLKIGAVAQILPLAAGYGVNLLATPYVVMQLGLYSFGIWSITGAIAQYAGLFDLGASRAANRYVALFHARDDADKDRSVVGVCVTVLIGVGALLYALAVLAAPAVEKVLRTGDAALTRFLLLCVVTMLVCGLLARVLAAASFGRGRQVPANIGLAVLGVAQVVGGVVALVIAPSLHNFALGTAIGAVVGFCAVVVAVVVDEGPVTIGRPSAALAREMIAFGVKGQAVGAADVVLFQSGKILAGIVIGPAAAGAYELGIRLVQGAQAFGAAASVAITTHLTRAYATGGMGAILQQYSQLTRRNAAVAIFLPFLLGATAISAVPLWLGEPALDVVTVVAALALGIAVNVSTAVCAASMFAVGRSGIIGATAVVSAIASVALAIPLTIAFGFKGLVAAYGCWIVVGNSLGVWFLQSRIGISLAEYLRAIRGPFVVAFLAAIAALPINVVATPDDRVSAVLPFVLSSAVFCLVYMFLGWRFDYLPRLRGERQQHTPEAGSEQTRGLNGASGTTDDAYADPRGDCPGSVAIIGSRGYPSFYGGFETLVRKLAPFLADRGWEVTVYGRPGTTSDAPEYQHSRIQSVTTKGIESNSLSTLTFGATSILDAANRKPDVALVMNVANGYWLPMLRARGIPSVLNVDGLEWQREKWNRLGKSVFKGGAQMTAKFADVLIADSAAIGRFWDETFGRDCVFIPYGGDLPGEGLELFDGLDDHRYVLLVARFVPENTIDEFLDAAEKLTDQHQVVIVGSSGNGGPLESRVQSISEKNERLTWLGHLSNDRMLHALWQHCGAYFHGHSVGGTNPALVQAMACGAPTIARDTVFNREVLLDSGVFVQPNPADIAAAIGTVMSNRALQGSLGSSAVARARDAYSWETICAEYERTLINSMTNRPAPSPRPAARQLIRTAASFLT